MSPDIFSFFCISSLLIWLGDPDEGECGLFTAVLCFPLLETPFNTLLLPIKLSIEWDGMMQSSLESVI